MGRPAPRLPADDVREYNLAVTNWKPGTMTVVKENRTPFGGVIESINAVQKQDGVWAPKWGSAYYNRAMPSFRKGSPATLTNLVTNPSLEVDTTNWAAFNTGTITRSAARAMLGTYSLKVDTTGSGAKGAIVGMVALGGAAAGVLMIESVYIWAPLGVLVTITTDQYNAGSSIVGTPAITSVIGTGGWQRVQLSVTVVAAATQVKTRFTATVATTFYVDALQLEVGSNASNYFDGATADTVAIDYAWTGTAHASTSTKSTYLYEPYPLDGAFEAVDPAGDPLLLEVAGGKLYRSVDGGPKTEVTISPGTLTAGHECFFLQIHSFVYIGNKHDHLVRYDTDAETAASYTALTTPAAPTLAKTGLVGTNYRAYYVIVASNLVGTTVGSAEASITVGKQRDDWPNSSTTLNTTDIVTVTITRVTNATRYSIFYSDESGLELYLDSVPDPGTGTTFDYVDRGTQAVNDFVELPNDDTTGGPNLGQMELSDNRIWALDGDNRQRVRWGGVGKYTGTFSQYYGGGYVDLELGGRETPEVLFHYRDGRGTAMVTVQTIDPAGNGSTWQITLDPITVGSVSGLIPNPVKIVGSIGAAGPRAACKVDDDIVFGNKKGAYALGSQPSLVNVLSTRELSANIRTSWRALDGSSMSGVAMYHYDAKIFMAVPNGSTNNSEIWIRDTERQNWQLGWTGIGIKSFFEATDATGHTHLLGVPSNGSQLIEFSPDIKGDLGVAFGVRIKTGRIYVDPKNHNIFAQLERLYVELGTPVGSITIDFYGYDYKKGFVALTNASMLIEGAANTTVPWGYQWSTKQWSHIEKVPTIVGESVVRQYRKSNRLVNSLQYVLTTKSIVDYFELLEFGAEGYLVKVDPPRAWKSTGVRVVVSTDAITDELGDPITDDAGNPLLV